MGKEAISEAVKQGRARSHVGFTRVARDCEEQRQQADHCGHPDKQQQWLGPAGHRGDEGDSGKWLEHGRVFKTEPTGFSKGLAGADNDCAEGWNCHELRREVSLGEGRKGDFVYQGDIAPGDTKPLALSICFLSFLTPREA